MSECFLGPVKCLGLTSRDVCRHSTSKLFLWAENIVEDRLGWYLMNAVLMCLSQILPSYGICLGL